MNRTPAPGFTCIFFILAVLWGCAPDSSNDGLSIDPLTESWSKIQWQKADRGAYRHFTCNGLQPSCSNAPGTTSSEFFFFARAGSVNSLVIYFQGGGACWHNNNCISAPSYIRQIADTAEGLDASSTNAGGSGGILNFVNENNPFRDWSFVFIPYCTGDLAWGAGDTAYSGGTIRHRGQVNVQVALAWIRNHFDSPDNIMVAGSSAGAFSAPFSFPFIRESFPDSQFYCIGDSGIGVVSPDFNSADYGARSWDIRPPTTSILPAGSTFDAFDSMDIADMDMTVIYTALADHYSDAVFGQYTTRYDTTMAMFYNMMLNIGSLASWLNISGVWCDWVAGMEEILDDEYSAISAGADNFQYYIAPGSSHTVLSSAAFYTTASNGVALVDWVTAMVDGTAGFASVACGECETPGAFPECH